MSYCPPAEVISAALIHAAEQAPREACGVVASGRYWPLANLASEPDRFVMDMKGFVRVAREQPIEAVVHSHVNDTAKPSDLDRANCEKIRLPSVIVSWPAGGHVVIMPSGYRAPLIGRQWGFGSHDCFSLVRDALAEISGISIPDCERGWRFWERGEDLISEGFAGAGFRLLGAGSAPKTCDVFAMQIRAHVPNHLALFLEPDLILHHAEGQLSRRDTYTPGWQALTAKHFRHEALA